MATGSELLDRLRALGDAGRDAGPRSQGCTARSEIWRDGKRVLYRYAPMGEPQLRTPLLICYALVNRPYMMDLQPDRSLIRALVSGGVDVYLIDWGYPDEGDRFVDLNAYVNETLADCIEHLQCRLGVSSVNLLGVCQGGTLSTCYTALHPATVKNLITMVTPIDFKTADNLLSKWAQQIDVVSMTRAGNVSGEFLNFVYLSLMPFRLTQQKYLALQDMSQGPSQLDYFLRMERWIFDSPDQAALAFAQFMTWFFKENRLMTGGLSIGGSTVDLQRIKCPVLNIYALKDHLVPPDASRALRGKVGSADYTEISVDVGHIGMYVSNKARLEVSPAITRWLQARDA